MNAIVTDYFFIVLIGSLLLYDFDCFDFWCFNATFSNISAISWRPVLVVEEAGVPGENHRPWASNCFYYYIKERFIRTNDIKVYTTTLFTQDQSIAGLIP